MLNAKRLSKRMAECKVQFKKNRTLHIAILLTALPHWAFSV
jgi:hypothetical protein